ncbi:MAG: tetratricopeptide repeat protein, partial [Lachnospiraceae bacterium]|nr:tetratricopeptide repeat protein [Lachnospiraceae bacterium]
MKHRVRAAFLAAAAMILLAGCAQSDAKRLYGEAGKALEASDFEAAAAAYSKVIDTGYYVSESYRGRGIAEMSLGDYPDAAVSLEKSLLYVDEQSEAFQRDVSLYLAHCRERQSKSDKAMEIYDSLILRSPDAETLFLRGRLNLRLDRGKAAESDFNQAVLLNPSYDLYINIYQIYDDMDRSGDGARYLEMALSEASRHAEDYYEQGLVSYYLQNYSDARDML